MPTGFLMRCAAFFLAMLAAPGLVVLAATSGEATEPPINPATASQLAPPFLRVAHVDLDYVYDPDPAQTQRNLDLLIQRVIDLGVNTVFLQAYADPTGDGLVRSLYFPNRHLPMRADLFKPVTQRLRTQANVRVYAWMPVLSFDLAADLPRITRWQPDALHTLPAPDPGQYVRLSPFDARVRALVGEIYEDLAQHTAFDGLLFHDDAIMSDYEDASPTALAAYAEQGLPTTVAALRGDSHASALWVQYKTRTLTQFTLRLRDTVRAIQGDHIKTARNLFAQPILDPDSQTWFAQNLDDFLTHYDWTAPMAMPLMEGVAPSASVQWLNLLIDQVATRPGALTKTIFELQSKDWSLPDSPPVSNALFGQWLDTLRLKEAHSFGYYPDDFYRNQPEIEIVMPYMTGTLPPTKNVNKAY